MNDRDDLDRFLAAGFAREARRPESSDQLNHLLMMARRTRQRPRWLALIKEPPMRHSSRVAVGSPTVRLTSVIVFVLATILTTSAAMVGATTLMSRLTAERPTSQAEGPGAFSPAPAMGLARGSHTATLLADGRILVVGGEGGSPMLRDEAEIRDPETGSFAATGSMAHARRYHTATLLENGRVLVVGGRGEEGPDPAESWDPVAGTFSPVAPTMTWHDLHTATLLQDGRVLIVGGGETGADSELWDPVSETFSLTDPLAYGRAWHAATLLEDGRVLVTGGNATAELWDPSIGTFEPAGRLVNPRVEHTATLLGDGSVLVIGGMAGNVFGGSPIASVERWDPTTQTFTSVASLAEPRAGHTATLLSDGRILVAGGYFVPTAEIWDDATSSFSPAGSMADARGGHTATLLGDDRVLVTGGYQDSEDTSVIASTEVWAPTAWSPARAFRDWPGPLRQEPVGGARIMYPWRTLDAGGGRVDLLYKDAAAEEGVAAVPWVDIVEMNQDGSSVGFELAGRPDPADPSDRWLAYGLVVDKDLDGRPDVRIGVDNAPGGMHRVWRTDLVTGETIVQTGPPYYRRDNDLPETYFPGAGDAVGARAGFRHALDHDSRATLGDALHIYFWASQIEDGRIVATDYAPDAGWLEVRPGDRASSPTGPAGDSDSGGPPTSTTDISEALTWTTVSTTQDCPVHCVRNRPGASGPTSPKRSSRRRATRPWDTETSRATRATRRRRGSISPPPSSVTRRSSSPCPKVPIERSRPIGGEPMAWCWTSMLTGSRTSGWGSTTRPVAHTASGRPISRPARRSPRSDRPTSSHRSRCPRPTTPDSNGGGGAFARFFGNILARYESSRLYAWSAEIDDGQIVAADYAPDAGWLVWSPPEA